jgi:hypothetical protein
MSTLHMLVEDVDCSAFTAAPEDGQFIVAVSKTGNDGTSLTISADDANSTSTGGHGLSMVWGSALRSDRSALGDSRVPVIRKGGGRFRTRCFNVDSADTDLSLWTEGAPLTVAAPTAAVQGSTDRLLLTLTAQGTTGAPSTTALDNCWIVGYVVRVVTDSVVSGTGEIEFYLYDQARLTTIDTP